MRECTGCSGRRGAAGLPHVVAATLCTVSFLATAQSKGQAERSPRKEKGTPKCLPAQCPKLLFDSTRAKFEASAVSLSSSSAPAQEKSSSTILPCSRRAISGLKGTFRHPATVPPKVICGPSDVVVATSTSSTTSPLMKFHEVSRRCCGNFHQLHNVTVNEVSLAYFTIFTFHVSLGSSQEVSLAIEGFATETVLGRTEGWQSRRGASKSVSIRARSRTFVGMRPPFHVKL